MRTNGGPCMARNHLQVALPLFEGIRAAAPDRVSTDCPLAGLQIGRGTGQNPVHPVEILREAYGIPDPGEKP